MPHSAATGAGIAGARATPPMDDAVVRAVARWPNVPAVYGWLSLTARGDWRIKGERIANPAVASFISRNYGADERGRWYFQNGPQRVFVTLELTPWIYRIERSRRPRMRLSCHTGAPVKKCESAWLDDRGNLLLVTEHGIGAVANRDLPAALEWLRRADGGAPDEAHVSQAMAAAARGADTGLVVLFGSAVLPVAGVGAAGIARRFGFDPAPRPAPGEPDC